MSTHDNDRRPEMIPFREGGEAGRNLHPGYAPEVNPAQGRYTMPHDMATQSPVQHDTVRTSVGNLKSPTAAALAATPAIARDDAMLRYLAHLDHGIEEASEDVDRVQQRLATLEDQRSVFLTMLNSSVSNAATKKDTRP